MNNQDKTYRKHPTINMKRDWIKLYYEQGVSVKSIADNSGYPVHTIYRVLSKMDPHRKERNDKGKPKDSPTIEVNFDKLSLQGESYETQIELLINEILRGISSNNKIKLSQALLYANQLMNALKKLRSIQFEHIAKNIDVQIVQEIIKLYEPQATQFRIIEVFKIASAKAKARNEQ